MSITRLTIFILGLTAIVVPARASLSYYTSATSFNTDNATDGFTLTTVSSFACANLVTAPNCTNGFSALEYADPTTAVEFFGFKTTGTGNMVQSTATNLTVASSQLQLQQGGGVIEIMLPADVFSFSATIADFPGTGTGDFCLEVGGAWASNGNCNGPFPIPASEASPQFVGALNTTGLPTTIWIGATNSSEPVIESFEIGVESDTAPDPGTMLTLGSGLILLALLRRRTPLFRFLNR